MLRSNTMSCREARWILTVVTFRSLSPSGRTSPRRSPPGTVLGPREALPGSPLAQRCHAVPQVTLRNVATLCPQPRPTSRPRRGQADPRSAEPLRPKRRPAPSLATRPHPRSRRAAAERRAIATTPLSAAEAVLPCQRRPGPQGRPCGRKKARTRSRCCPRNKPSWASRAASGALRALGGAQAMPPATRPPRGGAVSASWRRRSTVRAASCCSAQEPWATEAPRCCYVGPSVASA